MSTHTEEEFQVAALHNASLTGVIIGCCGKKGECTNYSVVEDFPDDAGKIFYERGWRIVWTVAMCPDCVRDNKRKAK